MEEDQKNGNTKRKERYRFTAKLNRIGRKSEYIEHMVKEYRV